ncbi:heme ABC transporter permease CcmC [Algimonas porphyrae]|uniref:Heme exporter protein C n=1 Tax=Algimonas porphyrae TaxID=1128113 RepID=A0ABQ5UW24_9PROT|nr:heme ABC transporter permease CcmC [Algimonas porphyrae]GLQ19366.1 heme exporter protein C [Algimonas porphyrae]
MIARFANPQRFVSLSRWLVPIFGWGALITLALGLWQALITSPAEVEHGQTVRIMYVHVPAAWSAMGAYTAIAIASLVSFVWRHPLADLAARSLALPGAAFTALALITGALWGKPDWGTYWQWDGRMTSVLVLLFIYIGYMAIWQVVEDRKRAARLAAITAMVGWINIPIIKFSVEWWNSLHQSATVSSPGAPGLAPELLTPLLLMGLGYTLLLGWLTLRAMLGEIARMRAARAPKQTASARMEAF